MNKNMNVDVNETTSVERLAQATKNTKTEGINNLHYSSIGMSNEERGQNTAAMPENGTPFINQQANKKSSNTKLAKRSKRTIQPGRSDDIMAKEVRSFVRSDPKINYQRIDPWVRNACQKMKSGKFQAGKFVPAIRKYVVDEALVGYGGKETPKNTDAATKNVIAAYVSKDIMAEAREFLKTGQKCRSYESAEGERWRMTYSGSSY